MVSKCLQNWGNERYRHQSWGHDLQILGWGVTMKYYLVFCLSFACLYCLKSDIVTSVTLFFTNNLYFRKKFLHDTFFSQFVLCHASNNTTSQNIGADGCMGRPPISNFGGQPVDDTLKPVLCVSVF